jgi:hypothetical protein
MDRQDFGGQVGQVDLGTEDARFHLAFFSRSLMPLLKARQAERVSCLPSVYRQQMLAVKKQHRKLAVIFPADIKPFRPRQLKISAPTAAGSFR